MEEQIKVETEPINVELSSNKNDQIIGYCMKCKDKRIMNNVEKVIKDTKRGKKNMAFGICPQCGTKMCKILKKEE